MADVTVVLPAIAVGMKLPGKLVVGSFDVGIGRLPAYSEYFVVIGRAEEMYLAGDLFAHLFKIFFAFAIIFLLRLAAVIEPLQKARRDERADGAMRILVGDAAERADVADRNWRLYSRKHVAFDGRELAGINPESVSLCPCDDRSLGRNRICRLAD